MFSLKNTVVSYPYPDDRSINHTSDEVIPVFSSPVSMLLRQSAIIPWQLPAFTLAHDIIYRRLNSGSTKCDLYLYIWNHSIITTRKIQRRKGMLILQGPFTLDTFFMPMCWTSMGIQGHKNALTSSLILSLLLHWGKGALAQFQPRFSPAGSRSKG